MKNKLLFGLTLAFLASSNIFAYEVVKSPVKPAVNKQLNQREAQTRAGDVSDYLIFQYSDDEIYAAYGLRDVPNAGYIYLAFEISPEDQKIFIGNQITAINVTTGTSDYRTNSVRNIMAFVTDDITSKPEETTQAALSAAEYRTTQVALDKPFTITGEKPIYVGYYFKNPGTDAYYIPVDGIPTDAPSTLAGVSQSVNGTPEYVNYSDQLGSLCLSCVIKGDNLPQNLGQIVSVDTPLFTAYENGTISYPITVKNQGANSINTVTVETSISNGSQSVNEITLDNPIAANSSGTINITGVSDKAEGIDLINSKLTKINGVEIENQVLKSAVANVFNSGFKRYPVIEKNTSIGCGWCPNGIVSFECIKKNFPDWILISIQENFQGVTDPMRTPDYDKMVRDYFTYFPEAITNRRTYTELEGNSPASYRQIYNMYTEHDAYGDIELTGTIDQDAREIKVDATTQFSVPVSIPHTLAFVIVEDGLGPYNQANYYSGGNQIMGGWESASRSVPTIFNEVARSLSGYPGNPNSLPQTLEGKKTYNYNTTLPLKNVSKDNFRVIGLIINEMTGEIINAKQYSFKWNGIEGVADDSQDIIRISVTGNDVNVTGANEVEVYSLSGVRVGTRNLPKGIYIVKADNTVKKIVVK